MSSKRAFALSAAIKKSSPPMCPIKNSFVDTVLKSVSLKRRMALSPI